jgi:hypothetical protein
VYLFACVCACACLFALMRARARVRMHVARVRVRLPARRARTRVRAALRRPRRSVRRARPSRPAPVRTAGMPHAPQPIGLWAEAGRQRPVGRGRSAEAGRQRPVGRRRSPLKPIPKGLDRAKSDSALRCFAPDGAGACAMIGLLRRYVAHGRVGAERRILHARPRRVTGAAACFA